MAPFGNALMPMTSGFVEMPRPQMASAVDAYYPAAASFAEPMIVMPKSRQLYAGTSPSGFPFSMHQLSNGHRIVIESRPSDLISLRTFVNAGSILEQSVKPSVLYPESTFRSGIAHLDEHCHFLSTKNYPGLNDWVKTVEKYGTRINASTSPEIIQHEMVFNKEDLGTMMAMHADAILNPQYKPEQIGQEKTNVINEMSERTLLGHNRVGNEVWSMLFDRPAFQTLGKPSDIKNTTSQELRNFFDSTYTPQNMVTVIAGNVNPQNILPSLERYFGARSPRAAERPEAAVRLALAPGQVRAKTVSDPELTYSLVHMAFPGPSRANPKERIALECLDHILFNRNFGVLSEQLLEKTALASDMATSMLPMKQTGMYEVLLHTSPGKEREALANVMQGLDAVSRGAVSQEQLDRAKGMMMSLFRKSADNAELVSSVLGEEALHGNVNYYLQYPQLLNSITLQDIWTAANKYVNPRTYVVAFGVPGRSNKSPGNPFAGNKPGKAVSTVKAGGER
jgi:zinc protease